MNKAKSSVYLGLEIGGTKLQIVVGDKSATILERLRFTVSKEAGGAGIRKQIEEALDDLRRRFHLLALGVGFGGPVNWKTGRIACSHQIEGWSDFPLADWLRELTNAPVRVDNDANTASLGEARHGAGAGYDPVFYVTLGSGVGGGLIVGGEIFHGAKPGESEIGHIRLDKSGRIVESSCSGWAVDEKIRRAVSNDSTNRLAVQAGGVVGGEARFLKQALAENDPTARSILDETAEDLAFGLSHVTHLFHPEVIVLGGGLSLLGEPLRAAVAGFLPGFLMDVFIPGPQISLASLGEDSVPAGALVLARMA